MLSPDRIQHVRLNHVHKRQLPRFLLRWQHNRRKEPLEAYPLDSMGMVGSVSKQGQPYALLRVENLLYQVKVGDYVGQNYGHVGNQQINDLLQQANTELDDTKRTELTQQADKAIWDAAGELPLYQLPGAVATKNTVANYGAMGFATNPIDYAKIGFVK